MLDLIIDMSASLSTLLAILSICLSIIVFIKEKK